MTRWATILMLILYQMAVRSLLDKGLVGIQRRGNGRSHLYAMVLPRRSLQVNAPAAGDDDLPPF
jgi:hypothetical protein